LWEGKSFIRDCRREKGAVSAYRGVALFGSGKKSIKELPVYRSITAPKVLDASHYKGNSFRFDLGGGLTQSWDLKEYNHRIRCEGKGGRKLPSG